MPISAPLNLGFIASASTPASLSITTGNAVAAGDCIVLWHYCNAAPETITSITDSSSNTYKNVFLSTAVAPQLDVWVCYNAASMASSSTITANFPGGLRHSISAWTITGTANTTPTGAGSPTLPLDLHTLTAANASKITAGVTSASSTVLNAYNNNQIILGAVLAGASMGTFTPGGSFTLLGGGTVNAATYPCYQIVANLTGVTFAPSWQTGQIAAVHSFALWGPSASTGGGGGGIIG